MHNILIAVEGIDGAGSSTQAKLLADYYKEKGLLVHLTAEPSQGPIGQIARKFLSADQHKTQKDYETLALLFAADRLHHYELEISPKLKAGYLVISDRYLLSSLVYQSLHLPLLWVQNINQYAPLPHITILVDVKEPIARERRSIRNSQKEIYDDTEIQNKLIKSYHELLPKDGILIDGNGSIEQTHQDILKTLKERIKVQ